MSCREWRWNQNRSRVSGRDLSQRRRDAACRSLARPAQGWRPLILPLTMDEARGAWFRIERGGDEFLAKWISAADLFPCEGARDAESERALVVGRPLANLA